jgi:hypothetical protein
MTALLRLSNTFALLPSLAGNAGMLRDVNIPGASTARPVPKKVQLAK